MPRWDERGHPAPNDLVEIACQAGANRDSLALTWEATGLTQYYVQIGGRDGQTGGLRWTLNCDPGPCPPYNDAEERAGSLGAPISFPFREEVDTRGATEEVGERLTCGGMGNTVWYVIYPNGIDTQLVIDTAGSDHDTAIAVYDGNFGPDGENNMLACGAGADGQRASLQFHLSGTINHYVQIGGRNGADGMLQVSMDCLGICPPFNDNATSAPRFYPAHSIFQTQGASLETGEAQPCGNTGKTTWYLLSPLDATKVVISTMDSDFPTAIAVYATDGSSPPRPAKNLACSTTGELEVDLTGGREMLVQVGGIDGAGGTLRFESICAGTCPAPSLGEEDPPGNVIHPPDSGSGGYLRQSSAAKR